MQDSVPRGIIEVNRCLSIKGAEDVINKPHAFEISTTEDSMFFIADSDKVSGSLLRCWHTASLGCSQGDVLVIKGCLRASYGSCAMSAFMFF